MFISNEELVNKNLLQKMYLANHPNVILSFNILVKTMKCECGRIKYRCKSHNQV